ncbi:antA/AntB antirepressor family protein [Histophilus somni]|uniref:antA/AntB antirepressor family protein n=1 Tax=Histophilus somni TaxID=731 RepID=UPI0011C2531D|nr:antA/AntB antirepressor family protein [Histophilus somni]QEH17324.1 phage antirepressor Ant [Histophilus somni]
MTHFNIKTFTGLILNIPTQLVNARDLHKELQSKQEFSNWIKHRISEYEFMENLDFIGVDNIIITEAGFLGKREKVVRDYHLTIDMVKELCMLKRKKLGGPVRRYFIKMEKKAILEIPRLQAENHVLKQQLLGIPTVLRQNPDMLLKLKKQAQQALLTAHPEYKEILRYRDMGLTNTEICTLLRLSPTALKRRLVKLFEFELIERKAQNQFTTKTQLLLTFNA